MALAPIRLRTNVKNVATQPGTLWPQKQWYEAYKSHRPSHWHRAWRTDEKSDTPSIDFGNGSPFGEPRGRRTLPYRLL
jgi:hypothetical protein